MDIETLEKTIAGLIALYAGDPTVTDKTRYPIMQCQLLLHIYHKLEEIEEGTHAIGSNMLEK